MTLIPCVSEKLFRPWDSSNRKETPVVESKTAALLKEEPRVASPAGSSSSSASSSSSLLDESTEGSSIISVADSSTDITATAAYNTAIQQAAFSYSAQMMSSAFLPQQPLPYHHHHHHLSFADSSAWIGRSYPTVHHHNHLLQPSQQQLIAPSMERFLASLESSPEALHPARLAALGMGPADIGELYQLAGLKPLHHHHHHVGSSAAAAASASSPSATHPSGKKQRPKRFRCPHCQVAFSNNGQLKGHVRSHTGKHNNTVNSN
jgi:huckebein